MADVRRYAEGTQVSAERSRAELEELLRKHGASEFAVYTSAERTVFMCRLKGTMVRHQVEYPKAGSFTVTRVPHGKSKADMQAKAKAKAQEAEWRRRWRALVLVCKAKLEIIESGGSTFEREFLADMLLADGQTVAQALVPMLQEMYETGQPPDFPRLLLGPGKKE